MERTVEFNIKVTMKERWVNENKQRSYDGMVGWNSLLNN